MTDIVKIAVCKGVEGPSVYINDYRVAGNKPWGGGKTIHSFKAEKSNIFHALKIEQILKEKDDEIERLRIALERAADALHDAQVLDAWAEARKELEGKNQ